VPGSACQTAGLRIVTYNGDEIDYSCGQSLRDAIEGSSILSQGQAEGAVVVMLSINDIGDQNRIHVDSPRGQDDLITVERTIAVLKEVRQALRTAAAA
jgi:lysophospholipase L1-like esterase